MPLASTRDSILKCKHPPPLVVNISTSLPATGIARKHSLQSSLPECRRSSRHIPATKDPKKPTMSGVTYWLQKQRKGELVDLAKYVGMKEYVLRDSLHLLSITKVES